MDMGEMVGERGLLSATGVRPRSGARRHADDGGGFRR